MPDHSTSCVRRNSEVSLPEIFRLLYYEKPRRSYARSLDELRQSGGTVERPPRFPCLKYSDGCIMRNLGGLMPDHSTSCVRRNS